MATALAATRRQTLSASTLTGDPVKNAAGEKLGDIKDLMIDLQTGRIAYVVLSFGGFLGFGDKLFAIPWGAMKLDTEDHAFVLSVDKERLENAPGFDKDHWPDTSDPRWHSQMHEYYRVSPFWE